VLFFSSALACSARGATSSGDFDAAVGDDAAPDLPMAPGRVAAYARSW
jgi:hypothetical protein